MAQNEELLMIVGALSGSGPRSDAMAVGMLETLRQMAKADAPRAITRRFRGLRKLVNHDNEEIAVLAAETLGAWGAAGRTELTALQNESHGNAVKHALAVALRESSGSRYEEPLAGLVATGEPGTRYAAAAGLAQANLRRGVHEAATLLTKDPEGLDPVPLVKSLLQHREGGPLLEEELRGVQIHPSVSASVSKFHRDSGLLPDGLAEFVSRSNKIRFSQ